MMNAHENTEFRRCIDGKEILLTYRFIGNDLHLFCYGGDSPHVGAVSLAIPYRNASGTMSASVSTLTAPNHRDDAISQFLAVRLAKALGCVTLAVCGIHYENATKDLIQKIQATVDGLADELLQNMNRELQ